MRLRHRLSGAAQVTAWLGEGTFAEALFNGSPVALAVLDGGGMIVAANDAFGRLTGASRESLLNHSFADAVAGPETSAFLRTALSQAAAGKTVSVEMTERTKDGVAPSLSLTSVPVPPTSRGVLVVVATDARPGRVYEALFQHSPNPILTLNWQCRVLAVNAAFLHHAGVTPDDIVGADLCERGDPEIAKFSRAAVEAAKTGRSHVAQVNLATREGERPFLLTSVPIGRYDPTHAAFVVGIDLQRTVEVEQQFRSFFDHVATPIVAFDTDLKVVDINPAATTLAGFTREQVLGRDAREFLDPETRERTLLGIQTALSGRPNTLETFAHARDNSLLEFRATHIPVYQYGKVRGVFALLEDLTERNRTQRLLQRQERELEDLQRDFHSLFEQSRNPVLAIDRDGRIIEANDAALQIGAYAREQVVEHHFALFVAHRDLDRARDYFSRSMQGEPLEFELNILSSTGKTLTVEVILIPKWFDGSVLGAYAIMQDVTRRREAEASAHLQAQRLRELYTLATLPESNDQYLKQALETGCRLLRVRCGAIVTNGGALRIEARYDGDGAETASAVILEVARGVLQSREVFVSDGWVAAPLSIGAGTHGALLFFVGDDAEREPLDASARDFVALLATQIGASMERRRARAHLRRLAYYDPLTDLPNRLYFQERLRDAIMDDESRSHRVGLLYIDIDRFKDVNETLGHGLGDALLQHVTQRLVAVAEGSALVARLGGDEFVVMLTDVTTRDTVAAAARRVLETLSEPYHIGDHEQYLSASIGISVFPDDGRNDMEMIKAADIAMYHAKERGGDRYDFFSRDLEAPLRDRLAQEKALRRALDHDEFLLHYQPILDLRKAEIVGVEALVRWQHPDRGLVFPDAFIGAAEASGLIVKLGDWVLVRAIEQLQRWAHGGLPDVHVAVNVSARQIYLPHFAQRVASLISQAHINAANVHFEITESLAMTDAAQTTQTVQQLKGLGTRIAVDDFGTGHSSLTYLRRFNVDHLKIDRSFVDGIGRETSDETIVKTLIAMGHSLGLLVVAEGVETGEQLEFLRANGCDRVQGYYVSPPVEAERIPPLILKRRGTGRGPD